MHTSSGSSLSANHSQIRQHLRKSRTNGVFAKKMISRWLSGSGWGLLVTLYVLVLFSNGVNCMAVMSIDLGSEWMKIAVVSPGVPMEIALNSESKRKTPTVVALRDDERTFGSHAMTVCAKHPKNCYIFLLDLLAKPLEHPSVQRYQRYFPWYELERDSSRSGGVVFRHDENTTYSPEELLGMILGHAKSIAEAYTNQTPVRDAVITVPVYFGQAERRAVLIAGEMAGLNVLQLVSEPMAVALNYGMFRRKEINATIKHLMFYDMGSVDTYVSIVSYQMIKTKERGYTETHPQAQIIGLGYDRTLGGLSLQLALRDWLGKTFNEMKKTSTDVFSVPRSMGKLFLEAAKVKNVLSANTDTYAQVENLLENIDFKHRVSRDELVEMNSDFFSRVMEPVRKALEVSGITMGEISEVILVGAGTRVPKIQEELSKFFGGRELGKSLNTDEAAAMGAVYKAADLSSGFKVKKFITRDAVLFPIDVDFERRFKDDDGNLVKKFIKRSLFAKMNPYPQKKIVTFNKHTDDFEFWVNLNELDYLGKDEIINVGYFNLSKSSVEGVAEVLEKNKGENIESKGIKAHFSLDDSGIINVTLVEAVFEKTITVEEQEEAEKKKKTEEVKEEEEEKDEKDEESKKKDAWSKIGESISNFFGVGSIDDETNDKEGGNEKVDDGEPGKKEEEEETVEKKKSKKEEKKKDKKEEEAKEKKKTEAKKPKIEHIKEPLKFVTTITDVEVLSDEKLAESKAKLAALDERDREKLAKETALNALESFVIDTREKLYEEIFEKSSTEEEREKIRDKCSEISDWIDEEVTPETEVNILESKLKEIKDLTSSLYVRVREHLDRPEAIAALKSMLNTSEYFIAKANNSTSVVDGYFTQKELDNLASKVVETKEWLEKAEKEIEEQPMYEMPKITNSIIAEKGMALDNEVKYMVGKAKIARAEKERTQREKEAQEEKLKMEQNAKEKEKAEADKPSGGDEPAADTEEGSSTEGVENDVGSGNRSTSEAPLGDSSEIPEQSKGESPVESQEEVIDESLVINEDKNYYKQEKEEEEEATRGRSEL